MGGLLLPYPEITEKDINDALVFCKYHFFGGLHESLGLDRCPCNCYCESCELIPESQVFIRMQEIARDMEEENVLTEFLEEHGNYIKDINFGEDSNGLEN